LTSTTRRTTRVPVLPVKVKSLFTPGTARAEPNQLSVTTWLEKPASMGLLARNRSLTPSLLLLMLLALQKDGESASS